MRPFSYEQAASSDDAVKLADTTADSAFLAGGTTLLDLMKLGVMQPATVVDINDLSSRHSDIKATEGGVHLGALARMADAADHPVIRRDYPVISQSLALAASTQLRHMATLGGNVLQRTRCSYFRDPSWTACNKRAPGSGCSALDGVNRRHAVLGVSPHCIATYPGDFAQALTALDATVHVAGAGGLRELPFEELHVEPGETPQVETVLGRGELITGFEIAAEPWFRRSMYLKVRDRESYDFALASAAVALDLDRGKVREARIALGGVATRPWRAREAEAVLAGGEFSADLAKRAATAAFAGAQSRSGNAYKVALGRRCLLRALTQTAAMEI